MLPSKQLVPPMERVANIDYRKKIRAWALESEANRKYLMDACREDFFFWLRSFAWITNPRAKRGQSVLLPFIDYPFQTKEMTRILDAFGESDIGIEKGRALGATYMCINIFLWHWLFFDQQELAMVSRNEDTADNPHDPSSLGAKLDYAIKLLPQWMAGVRGKGGPGRGHVWERNISKHTWSRFDNGSTITAYPTTGDVGSGARKRAIFVDEFAKFNRGDDANLMAAIGPVTNCRLLVSTYFGRDGAYYEAMTQPSSMLKVVLRWQDNPEYNQNKFRLDYANKRFLHETEDEEVVMADYYDTFFNELVPILENRGFDLKSTTKIWSPWYVSECTRPGATPVNIAQEHDLDPAGSSSSFVDYKIIDRLLASTKPEKWRGELDYTLDSYKPIRLVPSTLGGLRLWMSDIGKGWRPPHSDYILGCDVATGAGTSMTSNSAITILDRDTGTKVGEYSCNTISPARLAELAIALCRLFWDAYLIWEGNGPGLQFTAHVLASDYRNIYFRTQQQSISRKATKVAGWWSNKGPKRSMLGQYASALTDGLFFNPSEAAIKELAQYVALPGDRIEYVPVSSVELDPADVGESHGDRVIADAVANFAMEFLGGRKKLPIFQKNDDIVKNPPMGSFGERQQKFLAKRRKERDKKRYWG